MFEWKVENMELMNKGFLRMGKEKIYACETELTREEKIAFVDSMQDGKLSYILALSENLQKEKESLPKDQFGYIKTVSLRAWLKRNDERKLVDIECNYGRIKLFETKRHIEMLDRKYSFDTHQDYVDECFHRQLKKCESDEQKYFREHDEYSILKDQFRNVKHSTTFGIPIGYSSSGEVYIYDDECKYSREITIDELKILLSKYDQLDRYIEMLSSEVNIKY